MIDKVIEYLNEYGILQKDALVELKKFIDKLDKKKFQAFIGKLIHFLLASSESIGQIFDYTDGNFQEFNFLGLLLEGALMRGEAIHKIGSECLIKYVLSKDQ